MIWRIKICFLYFPDKESGEQLSKMVDDACMLLADYNGRLAAEIDDRKQLTRMLSDFLRCQKEVLTEKEQTLEVRNFVMVVLLSSYLLKCFTILIFLSVECNISFFLLSVM